MLNLAYRNLKVFFRDRASVFFSLMSVFIIIGLYVLFLGDAMRQGMEFENARFLMDSWIMAGLLAVTSITTTMGAFAIMVEDRMKKNLKDFQSAPLKRYQIAGGYILSSVAVGIIMSMITLILAEIYIVAYGGSVLPFVTMIKVLGLILLSVLSSSAMVYFIVSFFNSTNAFATASAIIGTLIGFLTGIYMPVGVLPSPVQTVIKIFPVSHAGALLRQVMMEAPMKTAFEGASPQMVTEFKEQMGIVFTYGDTTVGAATHIVVLIATTIVFYGLAILSISRKKNK